MALSTSIVVGVLKDKHDEWKSSEIRAEIVSHIQVLVTITGKDYHDSSFAPSVPPQDWL